MSGYCIDYWASGEIVQQRSGVQLLPVGGMNLLELQSPLPNTTSYAVKDGGVVFIGDPPTRWHRFDYIKWAWFDPRTADDVWLTVRSERTRKLAQSDWTQMPDSPLNPEIKHQWAVYRQALRDITNQPDPFNIVWPTPPA